MALIFDIPMIEDCRSCPIKNYIFEDDNGRDRCACGRYRLYLRNWHEKTPPKPFCRGCKLVGEFNPGKTTITLSTLEGTCKLSSEVKLHNKLRGETT